MLKLREPSVWLDNKCPAGGREMKCCCCYSPDTSKTTRKSGLNGVKYFHYYAILIVVLAYQLTNSPPCQSALLTNIYGGKKLSEITGDISHRFLLIPSPTAASRNFNHQSQLAKDMHTYKREQQQEQVEEQNRDPYSRLTLSRPPHLPDSGPINELLTPDETSHSSARRDSSSFGGEPMPSPSPLVTQWRQQQQQVQSQNNQKSARLMSVQQNVSNNYQLELSTVKSVLPGEPVVLENMSTEFPNPNINNLGHEITKILRKFFLHGYDKRVRPNYSGPPALVNVSFHIIGISSVDEVQMDFTTDFYFRQKWYDPRLEFKPVGQIDELCVGAEFAEKIWLPDTFFANEKTATFHKATTENTFIRVGSNGRVYRSIRLTVTCSCPMDLQYFPMDRQRCKIEIESYGYGTKDIDYRWEKGNESVSLDGKIELPQFKVLGFKMGQEVQNLTSGMYIRLYCEVHFVRSMGYYLIQIYIPASLIVIISWVSFWLHRNATPARVALGVTTVLTMTTLMSSTNAALPKISYIKSIDVFLGTCFVMVFASLLEYASVGYIGKRIAMKRKYQHDLKQMQQHHQKVCVAAAASAAAAAAAARQANPVGVAHGLIPNVAAKQLLVLNDRKSGKNNHQTTRAAAAGSEHSKSSPYLMVPPDGAIGAATNGQHQHHSSHKVVPEMLCPPPLPAPMLPLRHTADTGAPGTTTGTTSASTGLSPTGTNKLSMVGAQVGAGVGVAPQAPTDPTNDPSAVVTSKAQDQSAGESTVRICGLTPSDIDKYSRVVFPICFVCFNLMYWIIYGHISQQIDDHGPPLIPFVRS